LTETHESKEPTEEKHIPTEEEEEAQQKE